MKNKFITIFFSYGPSFKALVNTRKNEFSPWNHPLEFTYTEGNTTFINAFLVQIKQMGTCLLLFRNDATIVLNEQMKEVSCISYTSDSYEYLKIYYGMVVQPNNNLTTKHGSTWMMVFFTEEIPSEICDNIYEGKVRPDSNYWCMRWQINPDATIQPVNVKRESIVFQDE